MLFPPPLLFCQTTAAKGIQYRKAEGANCQKKATRDLDKSAPAQ